MFNGNYKFIVESMEKDIYIYGKYKSVRNPWKIQVMGVFTGEKRRKKVKLNL